MKKYFTKYLPVLEELKVGDKIKDIHNHPTWIATVTKIDNKWADLLYIDEDNVECRWSLDRNDWTKGKPDIPLKPFLCSNDIKEDNKVQHISGPVGIAFKINLQGEGNRTEILFQEDNTIHIIPMWLDEFFKVIGPISKDAIWVQEGFEYDDTQVKIPSTTKRLSNLGYEIMMKCPCCDTYK